MFWLANLCHHTAQQVDDLSLDDFRDYIDGIDAYLKAHQAQ